LPPAGYGGVAEAAEPGLPFLTDYQTALAEAKATHKPLFIDFTGYTCTNCRLNEKNVFPRPEIQKQFADFVRVQLYTDGGADGAKNEKLQQSKFDDVALPLYGVIDPSTEAVVDKTAGVIAPADFERFLENAKAKVGSIQTAIGASTALLPPDNATGNFKPAPWSKFDAAQIGKGTPTLVDFTATWCVNCHAIEKQVFDDPSVKPVLEKGFVTMRADMTDWGSPANTALQKQYGIDALPAVLLFDANGHEVKSARITGLLSKEEFLKRIAASH
jgi:thiol:disulfide interchange protein